MRSSLLSVSVLGLLLVVRVMGAEPDTASSEQSIRKRLSQPVSVDWSDISLRTALEKFSEVVDVPVTLDETRLREAGVDTDELVTDLSLSGVSASAVLNLILSPHRLTAEFVDDHLRILPAPPDETISYSVRDFLRSPHDEESLLKLAQYGGLREVGKSLEHLVIDSHFEFNEAEMTWQVTGPRRVHRQLDQLKKNVEAFQEASIRVDVQVVGVGASRMEDPFKAPLNGKLVSRELIERLSAEMGDFGRSPFFKTTTFTLRNGKTTIHDQWKINALKVPHEEKVKLTVCTSESPFSLAEELSTTQSNIVPWGTTIAFPMEPPVTMWETQRDSSPRWLYVIVTPHRPEEAMTSSD